VIGGSRSSTCLPWLAQMMESALSSHRHKSSPRSRGRTSAPLSSSSPRSSARNPPQDLNRNYELAVPTASPSGQDAHNCKLGRPQRTSLRRILFRVLEETLLHPPQPPVTPSNDFIERADLPARLRSFARTRIGSHEVNRILTIRISRDLDPGESPKQADLQRIQGA
jgi:hypothetical protein